TTAVQSIFEDSQKRLWVSSVSGVQQLQNGQFVAVDGVPGGTIRAIVEDGSKTLWFVNSLAGEFRLGEGGRRVDRVSLAAPKHAEPVSAAVADPSGAGLWLGFFAGGIAHFADGQTGAAYATSDGLAGGRVSGLYTDSSGTLWVTADGGLSALKNGRITTL